MTSSPAGLTGSRADEWRGTSRGGVTGYRIFYVVLRYLGIDAAYTLLHFVVPYFLLFAPTAVISSYRLYRSRLGFGFSKTIRLIYCNFYTFGTVLLDRAAFSIGIRTGITFVTDHHDRLAAMLEKGGILISAHIGNWEMASQFLGDMHSKINVVMRDTEYRNLKRFLDERVYRYRSYEVIPLDRQGDHVYAIMQALSKKEIICLHGDRSLSHSKTVTVPFLGKEASFPEGPFRLAAATEVPVSFVFAMKEGRKQYRLFATQARQFRFDIGSVREEALKEWVREYSRSLEEMVRRYPGQWFNYYDFWKNRPREKESN